MKLITNLKSDNHRKLLNQLILSSNKIVICSGWMKFNGLQKILSSLDKAIENNASITVFSNKEHTEEKAINALKERSHIKHIIADNQHRYLHSKIFHFENDKNFTSIIGSANITYGGLISNEELSVELSGVIGSNEHNEITQYLETLNVRLKE